MPKALKILLLFFSFLLLFLVFQERNNVSASCGGNECADQVGCNEWSTCYVSHTGCGFSDGSCLAMEPSECSYQGGSWGCHYQSPQSCPPCLQPDCSPVSGRSCAGGTGQCVSGVCVPNIICGNGVCEQSEDYTTCPQDCGYPCSGSGCPGGVTLCLPNCNSGSNCWCSQGSGAQTCSVNADCKGTIACPTNQTGSWYCNSGRCESYCYNSRSCTPGATTCGTCTNGTQSCSDGCSTWNQNCQKTCSITPTTYSAQQGTPLTINFSGNNNNNTIPSDSVNLWLERTDANPIPAPYPGQLYSYLNTNYYKLASCTSVGSTACSSMYSLSTTNLAAGNYYLHCDVPSAPNNCSGNPFCTYNGGTLLSCPGWVACSTTDQASITLTAPPPTCTPDLQPASASFVQGTAQNLAMNVAVSNGSVSRVDFSSSNTSRAVVSPTSDSSSPYQTTASGVSAGSATITAIAYVTGPGGSTTCRDTSTLTITPPGPWWQVKDMDVTTNGSISSAIPATCTLPICNPAFALAGSGGFPGIPTYLGSYDFSAGTGAGIVSDTYGWNADTQTSFRKVYNYAFFKSQIPSDIQSNIVEITSPSVTGGFFNSGGTPARGYVWYHYDGSSGLDLTITGNLNLARSRKVVLMVEGANLVIDGKINMQSRGNGFFMAIVGKNANDLKGDILIDPSVSSPNEPAIEGIFFAEGKVKTGAGSNQLYVRGSIAAMGGIVLERNLTDNSTQPAEFFEYAPEMMVLYPNVFQTRKMRWKEVAP